MPTAQRCISWSPTVITGFGLALASISSDCQQVLLTDSLNGHNSCILNEAEASFTSLSWSKDFLHIGTTAGEIISLDLHNNKKTALKKSDCVILFMTENCFVDARGRVFWKDQCILDDGILLPCSLAETETLIWFCKLQTIYRFDKITGSLSQWSLSDPLDTFAAGCLCADRFICVTASRLYYSIVDNELTQKTIVSSNEAINQTEAESDTEDETGQARPLVFGLLGRFGNLITLMRGASSKQSWLEYECLNTTAEVSVDAIPDESQILVKVNCPLCPTSTLQSLPVNTKSCQNGHPISICRSTLKRIDAPKHFRCRKCDCCYQERLDKCIACGWFLSFK